MSEKTSTALELLTTKADGFLEKARAVLRIRTEADRALVAALRVTNRDLQKEIHADLDPQVENAHKTHADLCALRRKHLEPLEREEARCKRLQDEDHAEQERAAELRRQKLQEKADAKAQQQRDAQVEDLRDRGQAALAAELALAPVAAPAVVVENKAELAAKAAGLGYYWVLGFDVEDLAKVPREFLQLNEAAVRARGQAIWAELKAADEKVAPTLFAGSNAVPGIRFRAKKESRDTGRRPR
jgi:hypothetical protein